MMRWWWFGPAVDKGKLEREMLRMKEGGIGGFEVQPVYPLAVDDPQHGFKNLAYLSDEFLDALRFTSQKAKELGLRMDLTLAIAMINSWNRLNVITGQVAGEWTAQWAADAGAPQRYGLKGPSGGLGSLCAAQR